MKRNTQSLHSKLLAFGSLCILVCSSVLVSMTVHAEDLKCRDHVISEQDERSALAALRDAIGPMEIDRSQSSFCRNDSNAHAWFKSVKTLAADGAIGFVSATCTRGMGRWRCELEKTTTSTEKVT
jgi:hypothetical protein